MSEAGSILDKLIAHAAAADATYSTTRGVKLVASLNDEDFPHVFAYGADVSTSELPFRQEAVAGEFTILIATKGETQEALLVRVDAYIARIQGDRTLAGDVDLALVTSYRIDEDLRSSIKGATMIVSVRKVE